MKSILITLLATATLMGQVTVSLSTPAPSAPNVSASVVGNNGNQQFNYWVVANYTAGSVIGNAALVQFAPATLTSTNFIRIGWNGLTGATSYDVVRLTPPALFSGSCTACLVASGLAVTTVNDTGTALTNYTASASAVPGNGQLYINTRDNRPPQLRQVINGVDSVVPTSGGSVASTTSTLKGDGSGGAVAVSGTGTDCVLVNGSSTGCGGAPVTIALTGTTGQITLTGTCTGSSGITCAFSLPNNVVLPGTINSLTITTSTGTLTIANAKVLTVNNTVTWTGTDGSTLQFGAGGTIFYTSTTLGCTQMPALTGDVSNTNCSVTVNQVNGAVVPLSATAVASNSSRQLIAATLQGNGAKVQASTGTTTTNDCVKFDVNGNTVDAGAACASGGISGLTTNTIPKASSATTIADSSVTDDGTTVTTSEDFVAKSISSSGSVAGILSLTNNGTPGTVKANSWGWTAPTTITTSWYGKAPNASPIANQVMLFGAPTSNVSSWTWTSISGSGSFCMTTSCVMTTPNLGTPSAGVGTNFTGIPPAAVTAAQGNGTKFQFSTGSVTTNNCAKFDANGNTVDAGGACGTATSSSAVSNITPVTVSANTTSAQVLQQLTIPAALFNISGAPFTYNASGIYTAAVAQTPTLTYTLNACTVSGCGSGTVWALAVIVTPSVVTATNNVWNIRLTISTTATGATGTLLAHGTAIVELTAASDLGTASSDSNTTSSGTIDLTAGLFLQLTVTTSTGNAGNSITCDKSSLEPASAQGATGPQGTAGASGAMVQLSQLTASGSSPTFSFTSISGAYTSLMVIVTGRSAAAATSETLDLTLNGNTGANYIRDQLYNNSASSASAFAATAQTKEQTCTITGNSFTASYTGSCIITIPLYSGTTFFKQMHISSGFNGTSPVYSIADAWSWFTQTAAITTVTLTADSGSNIQAGSIATLYGIL